MKKKAIVVSIIILFLVSNTIAFSAAALCNKSIARSKVSRNSKQIETKTNNKLNMQRPLHSSGETWIKMFHKNDASFGECIQPTKDNGYIITGTTVSYATGETDIWTVKINSKGTKVWDKTYGENIYDDAGCCIQETADGGYIIAGGMKGKILDPFTVHYNVGLMKIDPQGNVIWKKTFGDKQDDIAYWVQPTTDEGYIVAGYTQSYSTGKRDAWLIKTDKDGNTEWNKTYGGKKDDHARYIHQTTDGGYIITGSTSSFSKDQHRTLWLIKIYSNGSEEWNITFQNDENGYCVQETANEGYIVTGYTDELKLVLLKTDKNGETVWRKVFSNYGASEGNYIQQTDEGYVIAGMCFPDSRLWLGRGDAYWIKVDNDGNEIWSETFGLKMTNQELTCVQETSDGGYIFVGYNQRLLKNRDDLLIIKTDENGNTQSTTAFLLQELFGIM